MSPNSEKLWEELTLAQKFAVSSLMKFGYKLNFIRDIHDSKVAVLNCNKSLAVVSKGGEIETNPPIEIRDQS